MEQVRATSRDEVRRALDKLVYVIAQGRRDAVRSPVAHDSVFNAIDTNVERVRRAVHAAGRIEHTSVS